MKIKKRKIRRIIIVVAVVVITIISIGYLGLRILQYQLEEKITGCKIESKDFYTTIPFEYVNNWIIVKVKVAGSDKEFPFIFDTGAQTVLLDSLLNELNPKSYQSFSFSNKSENTENAFNNELISLHQLSMGEINFSDIGAISAKNSKWGMLNCISAYGIIGYNIIQTFYSQIDYDKKQIVLTDNLEKLPNYEKIQWLDYKPSIKQETPIIKASINDSIQIDLFFDTGNSGGIILNSDMLYDLFLHEDEVKTLKYYSKSSIKIRGEGDDTKESIVLKTSIFSTGDINMENINIGIGNVPSREFDGFIGNRYLENFIITLDYKSKRIGFIKKQKMIPDNSTFGINYVASQNKITISSVFEKSKAYGLGIRCGDTIHSINGIKVSNLKNDDFCKIYRNEYKFQTSQDSILTLEILKDKKLINYVLNKYEKF